MRRGNIGKVPLEDESSTWSSRPLERVHCFQLLVGFTNFVCWVLFAYPHLLLDWTGNLAFFDVDLQILLRFRLSGIWFRAEGRRNLAAQASLVGFVSGGL